MAAITLGVGYSTEHKIVRMLLIGSISLRERENQQNSMTIRLMSAMLSSKCSDFKQTGWILIWTGQKILSKTETQMLMRIYSSNIQRQHPKYKEQPLQTPILWK